MPKTEIQSALELARKQGAHTVWFSGGEPTLHPDLLWAISTAKSSGFDTIRIQSNGMRFSYATFVEACLQAGMNEVAFSIRGATDEVHSQLSQHPQAFSLLLKGLESLCGAGIKLVGDVLLSTRSLPQLDQLVTEFAERGICEFNFWLTSMHAVLDPACSQLVPSLQETAQALVKAFSGTLQDQTAAFTFFLIGLDFALRPGEEIVIAGEPTGADTQELLSALNLSFAPNKVALVKSDHNAERLSKFAGYTDGLQVVRGQTTAHMCKNGACKNSTSDMQAVLTHILKKENGAE